MGSWRVHRYVFVELLTPTLLALTMWTFVLLMNRFFVVAEMTLSKNLSWELTLRLFLSGIPTLLVFALPMSVLLGTLVAIGRLSADHEWVALQSAGQGPRRLVGPVMLLGLLATAAGWLLMGEVVPRSSYALRDLRGEVFLSSNLASDLKPRMFYTELPDTVLFVDEIRAGTSGHLEGVLLVRSHPDSNDRELIFAKRGDLYPALDQTGAVMIELEDGTLHVLDEESGASYRMLDRFESIRERIDPAAFIRALLEPPVKTVSDMTARELLDEYRQARSERDQLRHAEEAARAPMRIRADLRLNRTVIEIHQRLALPLAALVFALLGLPLGVTRGRAGKGAGFAISLLVILVYWAAFTLARNQASIGHLPAALGPWAGNLLLLPWAVVALWRMRRPAEPGTGIVHRALHGFGRLLSLLRPRRRDRGTIVGAADGEEEPTVIEEMTEIGGTGNRWVGRIDAYIVRAYLRMVLISVVATYLIFALVQTKSLVDDLLRNRQPFSLLLEYFKYFLPGQLQVTLPISCLIGAVVAFTLLARNGELTAMKAVGMSMRRATVSVLVLTLVLSAMLFLVEDRIVPTTNRRLESITDLARGRPPRTHGLPLENRWAFGPTGSKLYHYRLYDPDTGEFRGFRVFTLDRIHARVLDHRFAESARWDGTAWHLEHGWYRTFPATGDGIYKAFDEQMDEQLDPPETFFGEETAPDSPDDLAGQMSVAELYAQTAELRDRGYDVTKLEVALQGKVARSTSPFVMVLLGLPFAFRVGRRGSLYGIGVALVLVLVYWAVLAMFNALGMETILDARIAAWAPNVLFGLLGAYLMLFIRT